MSDISKQVLRAAHTVLNSPPGHFAEAAVDAIRQFVSSDFTIGPGKIVDRTGTKTSECSLLIYRADRDQGPGDAASILVDRVAVAIELHEELDERVLREAYGRIAEVKGLTKTAVPRGETRTNITLGIVFAKRSVTSLDALADTLYQLDSATSHKLWLDMVVVAPVGVINYAVQFPGEALAGDFMPPAEGALTFAPPAFYVTIVMRPTRELAFNKMVAFIIGHLVLFAPDTAPRQPKWEPILDGQPSGAITTLGFQPNLRGQLVPVPSEGYTGKFIPNRPVELMAPNGKPMASMQYTKWQDGGIITMAGKLPLQALLMFLPSFRPEYLRIMTRPTHQISPVMQLSLQQFGQFVTNIQQRGGLRVSNKASGVVMQKFLDEGSSSPFIARCTLGLLRIRENVFGESDERDNFDKIFESAFQSLLSARSACNNLHEIWHKHLDRVGSGEAARIEGRDIRVIENVNKQLSESFEAFLNASTRAIKTGVQALCTFVGSDIGFLFKKASAFDASVEKLRQKDLPLAEYLVCARPWTERLVLLRNDLEHTVWQFPKVGYAIDGAELRATEPQIDGEGVTAIVGHLLDRTLCFFEEVVVHMLQQQLADGTTITEIEVGQRVREAPERFRITLAQGGEPPWRIAYHDSKFEET